MVQEAQHCLKVVTHPMTIWFLFLFLFFWDGNGMAWNGMAPKASRSKMDD
jgi:hypothetical protein